MAIETSCVIKAPVKIFFASKPFVHIVSPSAGWVLFIQLRLTVALVSDTAHLDPFVELGKNFIRDMIRTMLRNGIGVIAHPGQLFLNRVIETG